MLFQCEIYEKIGWFTTARGPGSLNLYNTMIERMDSGDINAELAFVFINRDIKDNVYRAEIVTQLKNAASL